ncbi:MAG: hypothetical protein U0Q12_04280 [Vicinamibacterales bacterium]
MSRWCGATDMKTEIGAPFDGRNRTQARAVSVGSGLKSARRSSKNTPVAPSANHSL